ncbi:MAG TPA: hypothetical protein VN915_01080 [Elusimicrobiota bacterium]|nr:hypothetical protein [Elusimicrobiota bacterium]
MKRIPRDPEKFEAMRLIEAIGRKANVPLSDGASDEAIVNGFASTLERVRNTPILIQGTRTEKMFGFVAASLGWCAAVKEEDAGELYSLDLNLRMPDYRLVLKDSRTLLVEVKNCHKSTGFFSIRESDLTGLAAYARVFPGELRLAIYWSGWNTWTLIDPVRMRRGKTRRSISHGEAHKINEMCVLGDFMPATRPPLVVRFIPKSGVPENLLPGGRATFTFNAVEFYCGQQKIENEVERALASYLIMFGNWPAKDPEPEKEEGKLISAYAVVEPEQETPGQGFELFDALSSMISRRYRALTSDDAGIARLVPKNEPGTLGIVVPDDYKGQQLPIWRFRVQPNSEPQEWEAKWQNPG